MPRFNNLISVLIPTFNGQRTIAKTLSSILNQDYTPLELLVVDDCSKDSTASQVKDYLSKETSVPFRLINHEQNLGLAKTLNDGIKASQGDYLLILHQDCELVGNSWISKAASIMKDEKISIVTGYYGVPDFEDKSFVKRAFGILRKQFHTQPSSVTEEVTFSEGKCDLYRKEYLLNAGGFPTNYRIAGEDLVVSYTLRQQGYKIIKSYDLPVIQRFTGKAETFNGNLSKEFVFGKAMGGVFSKFNFYLFKGVRGSRYSGSRSIHRASQPVFVLAAVLTLMLSFVTSIWFLLFFVAFLLARFVYYVRRVNAEFELYKGYVRHFKIESIITALIGIVTDFAYTFGFGYGAIKYSLGMKL